MHVVIYNYTPQAVATLSSYSSNTTNASTTLQYLFLVNIILTCTDVWGLKPSPA